MDVLALDPRVTPTMYKVAGVLGAHFNKNKAETFIKHETIAAVIKMSPRTVWDAVQHLERLGYLLIVRREFGSHLRKKKDGSLVRIREAGARGRANVYRPAFESSQLTATYPARKLASRCELYWAQSSQSDGRKLAKPCEPTLTSPSSKGNPSRGGARERGLDDAFKPVDGLRVHVPEPDAQKAFSEERWRVSPGTAQFDAWRTYYGDLGASRAIRAMEECTLNGEGFTVPAKWPPAAKRVG
jgi:biotin operon repressor